LDDSSGSAIAGIRAVGLPTVDTRCRRIIRTTAALKNVFRIKVCLTKEFTNRVGFVKVCA
jgi:hypothetical protein